MKINNISNIVLKGQKWRDTLEKYKKFFVQKNQPNYSIFILSATIGIIYDKQIDSVIEKNEEEVEENNFYVPKTVLDNHIDNIIDLLQTAILSSSTIVYSPEDRLSLAFNPDSRIEFNEMNFLIKFANYGLSKLNELYDEEPLTMMYNWTNFLEKVHNNKQFDIFSIDDTEL